MIVLSRSCGRTVLLAAVVVLFAGTIVTKAVAQHTAAEGQAATSKTELDTMQAIENTWSEALLKHDQFGLESVLAPGYVDISADGEVTTRNQQIARMLQPGAEAISFDQRVVSVRLFGDITVVNGTYVLRYTREGHPVEDKGIFSHVFQKTRARWQCINSQRTFVVEQAASGKKQSSGLPFHLPGTRTKPAPTPAPAAVPPGPQ